MPLDNRFQREKTARLFVNAMTRELAANEYKGDPSELDTETLFGELVGHLQKLLWMIALVEEAKEHRYEFLDYEKRRTLEYAADCANLILFMAHNVGVLDPKVIASRVREPDYVPSPWSREETY